MNKPLFGMLAVATLLSASLYGKVGVRADNRLAAASAPRGPAAAPTAIAHDTAPPMAVAGTAMPDELAPAALADAFVSTSEQPAKAHAVRTLHKVAVAKTPHLIHSTWVAPTVAAPAAGTVLPVNFPPPVDE